MSLTSGFLRRISLMLVMASISLCAVADGQVPDIWRNTHCPNAVNEGGIQRTPYFERAEYHAMRGEDEERDAVLEQSQRYTLCMVFIVQNSATPLLAYRSREVVLESAGSNAEEELFSLETILKKAREMTENSDRIFDVIEDMYRTAYTEEYAHMGDREAMRKLTESYFCECLNIPVEEFKDP